jgi:hypothetical protein
MTDVAAETSPADQQTMCCRVVEAVSKVLPSRFPGASGKPDTKAKWADVDGNHMVVGRTCTFPLIKGHATLVVEALDGSITIVLTHGTAEHDQTIPYADIPQPTPEQIAKGHGWRDEVKQRRNLLVADAAAALVAPILEAEWLAHKAEVEHFSAASEAASRYADYHGDRVVFEHVADCGTASRFKIITDSSSGGTWIGDIPPVDGQECWIVNTRLPSLHVGRLRRNDRFDNGRSGLRIFEVDDIGANGGRPKFAPDGSGFDLMVPQGKLTTMRDSHGVFIPRSPMTDRLAKLATIALNRMDNNESRKAVIQAAFGDVLKTALTDAVARVDAAALKLDKASDKLAAGGPIDGVGGLLDC